MDPYRRFFEIFKDEPLVSRQQGGGKVPVVELGKKPRASADFDKLEYVDIGTVLIDKTSRESFVLGLEEMNYRQISSLSPTYSTFDEPKILFQSVVPRGIQYSFVPIKGVDFFPHVYGKICDSDGLIAQGAIKICVYEPDARFKFVALGASIAQINMASPDDPDQMLFFQTSPRAAEGDIIRCIVNGATRISPEKSTVTMSTISLRRIV